MNLEENILRRLIESPERLSGELLAKELKVSRVAIWKSIKKLKEKGYPIDTAKRGYFLENKDILLKEDLRSLISKSKLFTEVVHLWETPSTMEVAKALAEAGQRAIVIAERQTKGRGRMNRDWDSPQGGIWLTFVLLEPFPLKRSFLLTYLASVATAKAIIDVTKLAAKVKWPNDVLVAGKKVAGILLEIKAEVDALVYALVGIGINVNNPVEGKPYLLPASSLRELTGELITRKNLLERLISCFEDSFFNLERLLEEWRDLSETLGKEVKIKTFQEEIVGYALDLSPDGALLVKTKEGHIKNVFSGDCIHLR
ncbi:MAG: biotin--[acetyl-CoA-carboxylase] ligase [Caldimicrobium sp.]|nr:biotin--[acetyl-CoA-carboxylase] ligase [Caldimicrobium sp.]MCX7613462.1 biotin--[acetyl-CoA-carboxylase] ligase [Caldimicrobium sp.]MDW8182966.1 biotin--[acetyl-CoA-carboxylase] ligase [Caldimicrobium sp.]